MSFNNRGNYRGKTSIPSSVSDKTDLEYCVEYLATERFGAKEAQRILADAAGDEGVLFARFRDFVNVRKPYPADESFLAAQDRVLQEQIAAAGITDAAQLERTRFDNRMSLWRGDITTLRVDAIVNAANSQMLGCWIPGHYCIDNAIHTYAGIQLRAECDRLMQAQGFPEPTGMAKVTPAYNLPSQWIIHTVGPITSGEAGEVECRLLADCYRSCLSAATEVGAQTIAFCCISTGVFGFPQDLAAQIAVKTVHSWLNDENSDTQVVFNVFGKADEDLYSELLFG